MESDMLATAVYGMLQYYGVMPVTDLFLLCNRCNLYPLTAYQAFLKSIQAEQTLTGRAFCYKKLVCHKQVRNPLMLWELQKQTVAGGYKVFSLEAYLEAGTTNLLWNDTVYSLKQLFKRYSPQTECFLNAELERLWMEINNMADFVKLTAQCAAHLHLPWQADTAAYMKLMEYICTMAREMPRWSCKGYSYAELLYERDLERN